MAMVRTALGLLILNLHVIAGACAPGPQPVVLDTCTSKRVHNAAEAAFFGFAKEVAPCWQRLLVRVGRVTQALP